MLVDLSHPIEDGRGAFPGLPPPRIGPILDHDASRERYQGKAEFFLGHAEIATNTATYLDAPFHRFRDREDIAGISLDRVTALPGLVVDASAEPGPVEIEAGDLEGRAVLVRTGRDELWPSDEYWSRGPYLSERAIGALLGEGAALVGVDFGNVDDIEDPSRPAHTRLLEAGVLIVENLRGLGPLPREDFRFTAAPVAVVGAASFPVRAFAEIP
ncbi:MAG TPA: cyclase family protein [Actinomycetota bacterium]|nr:cyclase family protein [Actinomycetota bacterium]